MNGIDPRARIEELLLSERWRTPGLSQADMTALTELHQTRHRERVERGIREASERLLCVDDPCPGSWCHPGTGMYDPFSGKGANGNGTFKV